MDRSRVWTLRLWLPVVALLVAGCSHQPASVTARAPVPGTAGPAPAAPSQAFEPYQVVQGLPPKPAHPERHRARLQLVHRSSGYWLTDASGRAYRAARDRSGRLYPAYEDPGSRRFYPLRYDSDRDRYYRVLRDDGGRTYRSYVDEPRDRFYTDYGDETRDQDLGYGQPEVEAPKRHHSQDWLVAVPLVAAAYLLLRPHHHRAPTPVAVQPPVSIVRPAPPWRPAPVPPGSTARVRPPAQMAATPARGTATLSPIPRRPLNRAPQAMPPSGPRAVSNVLRAAPGAPPAAAPPQVSAARPARGAAALSPASRRALAQADAQRRTQTPAPGAPSLSPALRRPLAGATVPPRPPAPVRGAPALSPASRRAVAQADAQRRTPVAPRGATALSPTPPKVPSQADAQRRATAPTRGTSNPSPASRRALHHALGSPPPGPGRNRLAQQTSPQVLSHTAPKPSGPTATTRPDRPSSQPPHALSPGRAAVSPLRRPQAARLSEPARPRPYAPNALTRVTPPVPARRPEVRRRTTPLPFRVQSHSVPPAPAPRARAHAVVPVPVRPVEPHRPTVPVASRVTAPARRAETHAAASPVPRPKPAPPPAPVRVEPHRTPASAARRTEARKAAPPALVPPGLAKKGGVPPGQARKSKPPPDQGHPNPGR